MRSLSLLEGIARRADPAFSLMEEAYPYVLERMLLDNSEEMKRALRYIVYGRGNVFNARRFIAARPRPAPRRAGAPSSLSAPPRPRPGGAAFAFFRNIV